MTDPMAKGRLVLVPNTLDLGCTDQAAPQPDLQQVLPRAVIDMAARLGHWVAENAKTTRAFLKRVDAVQPLAQPLQAISVLELPRPRKGDKARIASDTGAWDALLQPALQGHDLGLISEAGLPGVADPGAELVLAAHRLGITVLPLSGPSALILAVAASGLQGQSFAFCGYLPTDASQRAQRIRALEQVSRQARQTQLVIETPYRNAALWAALLQHLQGSTLLHVSCGLTLPQGFSKTLSVAGWRQQAVLPLPADVPAVFAWLA